MQATNLPILPSGARYPAGGTGLKGTNKWSSANMHLKVGGEAVKVGGFFFVLLTGCFISQETGITYHPCAGLVYTLLISCGIIKFWRWCGCLCVALPAVKIVDIRQVSKQNISLVAQAGGQERREGGVVHLCPVALQHSSRTKQHLSSFHFCV